MVIFICFLYGISEFKAMFNNRTFHIEERIWQ